MWREAEIGFVLHFWFVGRALGGRDWVRFAFFGVAGHLVYENWVRFAFLVCGPGGRGVKIGFPDVHRDFAALSGGIGFVLRFLVRHRSVGAEIGFVLRKAAYGR